MGIEKQSMQKEKDYEWYDEKYYDVPNVVGLTRSEAKRLLSSFSVSFVGDGDVVIEQSIAAGTRYYDGGLIKLLMK